MLLVPPVLAPDEHNCLLNPAHPEFKRIVLLAPEPMALRSTNVWQTRSPTATATATLIIAQPHAVIGCGVAANRGGPKFPYTLPVTGTFLGRCLSPPIGELGQLPGSALDGISQSTRHDDANPNMQAGIPSLSKKMSILE